MKFFQVAAFAAAALAVTSGPSPQNRVSWPEVESKTRSFHFDSAAKSTVKFTIDSPQGTPLYALECHTPQTAPTDGEFMWSGDFECRLSSIQDKEGYSTLLTELPNADRDWESRGRFLSEQLEPPCRTYTNLGQTREFELRGFKLVISLSNIRLGAPNSSFSGKTKGLIAFEVKFEISPDGDANSPIAATPPLPSFGSLPNACQKAFDTLYLRRLTRPSN